MRHFISVDQFTEDEIQDLLQTAEHYRMGGSPEFSKPLFAANLFFEPSTRTKMSFTMAQKRLGIETLDFHMDTSSTKKGETLYDTARTMQAIGADLLVIRHASDTWSNELQQKLSIPIINAGAGKAEHPTQCMLDLLTIYQEFARFSGLKIVIAGDIRHSRVAQSNAKALKQLGADVYLCAPPGFQDKSLDFPYVTMDEAAEISDVLMLLRIQHERHQGESGSSDDYLKNYGLTKARERKMRNHSIILHPAPVNRGVEIDSDLVECRRSRIFKQMQNGVYVRMAVIARMLQEWGMTGEDTIKKYQPVLASR
ncbi:aspartate carbamoyltransferase catalytic subunit [Virgibacillus xinjiangensis]|uniref:Aspartate carbamoyltransferase n=1 Tax=Virgibacillus xinjiangensis TaxID=393090 RepID=A0ABV7CUV2_9BACI